MESAPKRYLGWTAPAASLVAQALKQEATLEPLLIVVPTKESARLLNEQIALQSSLDTAQNRARLSPQVVSIKHFSAHAHGSLSIAAELQIWFQLLCEQGARYPSLYPQGKSYSQETWLREAQQKISLLHNLAQEGIDAQSPQWQAWAENDPRWRDLGDLQTRYRQKLQALGLLDSCAPAQLDLAEGTRIILAALPYLPQRARHMLRQSGHKAEVWIHAPEELSYAFDEWGSPTLDWLSPTNAHALGLAQPDWANNYVQAADSWTMCQLAAQRAAQINAQQPLSPHQIGMGLCDAATEATMVEELCHHGAQVYSPRGLSFSRSCYHKLLRELQKILRVLELAGLKAEASRESYPAPCLIRLLKWPEMLQALCENELPPAQHEAIVRRLDRIQLTGIPTSLSSLKLQLQRSEADEIQQILHVALHTLSQQIKQAIQSPAQLLKQLRLWAEQTTPPDPIGQQFSEGFITLIDELSPLISSEATSTPASTLQLLELCASTIKASEPHLGMSLELLGWAELLYSPARHLVIVGMHESKIPERWPTDPLLTRDARQALGLPNDEQLAARDAFMLRSLIGSREAGALSFYFSLFDSKNNPHSPSSLLMRLCPDSMLAPFVRHFFAHLEKAPRSATPAPDESSWVFQVIKKLPAKPAELASMSLAQLGQANPMEGKSFSPSSLRQFLSCPLRFWLSKIFKLDANAVTEDKKELNAQELGTCLHSVLEQLIKRYPSYTHFQQAQPLAPAQVDPEHEALLQLLESELTQIFKQEYQKQYGTQGLLPQELQRKGILMRLHAFAPLQLKLWAEGWECARDEAGALMLEHRIKWQLGKHTLNMTADRIDTRLTPQGEREYRVIDYKSGRINKCLSEHTETLTADALDALKLLDDPRLTPLCLPSGKKSIKKLRWINLQLPLYAAWLHEQYPHAPISTGYIHLAKNAAETSLKLWQPPDEAIDLFATLELEENPEHIECLMDSAMDWAQACMDLIAQGRGLVPAEMLHWKLTRDYLFDEMTQRQDLLELFFTPHPAPTP